MAGGSDRRVNNISIICERLTVARVHVQSPPCCHNQQKLEEQCTSKTSSFKLDCNQLLICSHLLLHQGWRDDCVHQKP